MIPEPKKFYMKIFYNCLLTNLFLFSCHITALKLHARKLSDEQDLCKIGTEKIFNYHKIRILRFNISKTNNLILMPHMSILLGTLVAHVSFIGKRVTYFRVFPGPFRHGGICPPPPHKCRRTKP